MARIGGNSVQAKVPEINVRSMAVKVIGDSPLIVHRFAHKAQQQILDKQMKEAKQARPPKNPEQEYQESLYPIPNKKSRYGFPSAGFKAAAVGACSSVDGITKVIARGAFHVLGDLVEIEGRPRMRQDTVRIGMGKTDIRFRGEFPSWSVTLPIRYNASVLSPSQIINLINTAGFAVGVGEWRPGSKSGGSFGMFHVEGTKEGGMD